jgi:hypothetical protein
MDIPIHYQYALKTEEIRNDLSRKFEFVSENTVQDDELQ